MTNYIETLEQNAKRAKEAYSMFDYKPGTATAEYNAYCKNAEDVAEKVKEKLAKAHAPEERAAKVDYLLNRYKTKKLSWLNALYINRASCPSVLIAGPANFPVKKKERQNAREDALMKEDPEYIIEKIRGIGHNANTIYSDEKDAVDRIKAKIETLKSSPDPYGNKAAEIRRLKERLFQLAPEEFAEQQSNITVNDVKTYDDIINLWNTGSLHKSRFDATSENWYYDLALNFYDGKRHYKELVSIEVDETGENRKLYNFYKHETELIPLTDEYKYKLIIGQISGSGNKAIIYKHLQSLIPAPLTDNTASDNDDTIKINGESASVVRNKEEMRLQLFFDGKPSEETRGILKANGFRWAPSCKAWQRLLNENSLFALRRIADKEA